MDTDDVSWLQSLLESRRPDPGPVVGRWALGIGDMVADHPLTLNKVRGLVRKLNHFGGVGRCDRNPDPKPGRVPAASTSRPTSCR